MVLNVSNNNERLLADYFPDQEFVNNKSIFDSN